MSLRLLLVVTFLVAAKMESEMKLLQTSEPCKEACGAAETTDPEVIRGLINQGNDLCQCICDEKTGDGLIHASVESKCGLCIDLLTSSPADCPCDQVDNSDNTAFHYAAKQCRMEILNDLLQAECSAKKLSNMNNTPLCVTSRVDDEECGGVARELMAAEADPCFVCSDHVSAIDGCNNTVVCDVMNQDLEKEFN